jgi:hypothetical protein
MQIASSTRSFATFTETTMAKKKKPILTPELREEFARTMRVLEERVMYHRRKTAEEEARRNASG